MPKPYKVQRPKNQVHYVATKSGVICATSGRKIDMIAWKRAFGATVWKATTTYELIQDTGEPRKE